MTSMIKPHIAPCKSNLHGGPAWSCASSRSGTKFISTTPLAAYIYWLRNYRPLSPERRQARIDMMLRLKAIR